MSIVETKVMTIGDIAYRFIRHQERKQCEQIDRQTDKVKI